MREKLLTLIRERAAYFALGALVCSLTGATESVSSSGCRGYQDGAGCTVCGPEALVTCVQREWTMCSPTETTALASEDSPSIKRVSTGAASNATTAEARSIQASDASDDEHGRVVVTPTTSLGFVTTSGAHVATGGIQARASDLVLSYVSHAEAKGTRQAPIVTRTEGEMTVTDGAREGETSGASGVIATATDAAAYDGPAGRWASAQDGEVAIPSASTLRRDTQAIVSETSAVAVETSAISTEIQSIAAEGAEVRTEVQASSVTRAEVSQFALRTDTGGTATDTNATRTGTTASATDTAGSVQNLCFCQGTGEVCDGIDNDCDGLVDEDLGSTTCGVGACEVTVQNCMGGASQACTPGAPSAEVCEGIDNDCDGQIDEVGGIVDLDGDGWTCAADCNEGDPTIHPGAVDCLNGIDENCNGIDGDGVNRVEGYAAFDVDPSTTGEEVRITNAIVFLCEVGQSGASTNCRPQVVDPADGTYAFECIPWGTYRVQTTLNWTDRVIVNDHDPRSPVTENRSVEGRTRDFNLSPAGGTSSLQPTLFKTPVVFVHGANAGPCLERPGITCSTTTCSLYQSGWTAALDRFLADGYPSFVADGLAPCEALIQECENGSPCLAGTICNDGSECTRRCPDQSVCGSLSSCEGGIPCPTGFKRDLHDYNAEQLAAYLAHVQSVLTTFTGGKQVPVDIVAHSMGGLTARDLIGSNIGKSWSPLIRKLVMLGTPNAGSVNAERWVAPAFRPDSSYLNRKALWKFNQLYGSEGSRKEPAFYYISGAGGESSPNGWYRIGWKREPKPNDGIVGRQSIFDFDLVDNGADTVENEDFRTHKNCQPPKDSTSTDDCLIRIQADAYVCTPDDHSQLQETTATLNAVQNLLAKGSTAPAFPCTGAPSALGVLAVDSVPRLTRQSRGTLNPLSSVEHQHVIDNSTESVFSVEWQTGTFTFTLEDPLGQVIDPGEAAVNPDIEYLGGRNEQGSVLAYMIQNPMSGAWKLRITAGSDVSPTGQLYLAETSSNAVVDVVGASLTDPADVGGTVALTASLTDDSAPITGGTVVALATDRLGASTPLTCLDAGISPDVTGGDGVYTCSYGPIDLSGHHVVEFQASGSRVDGTPFERSDTFILSVNSTDASIDGTFSEVTPDVNANLLHDSLNIGVDITVVVDGQYGLEGTLVDGSNAVVGHEVVAGQMLTEGANTLTLVFGGVAIREHGANGPYILTHLVLTRSDADRAVCEEVVNAYTTGTYSWTDFEIPDPDGDGIEAASDNCPFAADPLQEDSDGDMVGDVCDNCPGTSNAGQVDEDGDGFGDACDLCPSTGDVYQSDADGDAFGDNCDPDADGDGVPNVSDCAILDATLWSSPSDVTDLSFTDSVTLSWTGQTAADGSTTTFDVVKGDLAILLSSAGDFTAAVCFAAKNPATTATDSLVPSAGGSFYYLVRARSRCAVGSYGVGATGERGVLSCP